MSFYYTSPYLVALFKIKKIIIYIYIFFFYTGFYGRVRFTGFRYVPVKVKPEAEMLSRLRDAKSNQSMQKQDNTA